MPVISRPILAIFAPWFLLHEYGHICELRYVSCAQSIDGRRTACVMIFSYVDFPTNEMKEFNEFIRAAGERIHINVVNVQKIQHANWGTAQK